MNMRIPEVVGLVVIIILLAVSGCAVSGRLRTESQSVELGGAESALVEIKMGAGFLQIGGGADELLNADFTYNVASWRPEVEYHVSGTQGQLTVQQPAAAIGIPLGKYTYEWDLRLNDDVPMALSVDLGVGNGNLDLGRLSLTSLDIQAGAGNITVDLTGIRSLTSLGLEMGAGNVTLDLTGDLEKDLNASIRGGVGTANVRLPSNVGVRVEARGALGTVNARGLTRDGNAYINDAYGQSDVTLRINIEGAVGTVNLELGD